MPTALLRTAHASLLTLPGDLLAEPLAAHLQPACRYSEGDTSTVLTEEEESELAAKGAAVTLQAAARGWQQRASPEPLRYERSGWPRGRE